MTCVILRFSSREINLSFASWLCAFRAAAKFCDFSDRLKNIFKKLKSGLSAKVWWPMASFRHNLREERGLFSSFSSVSVSNTSEPVRVS